MTQEPLCIFVYGTLKRGQIRERCWPRQPAAVEPATVRGALFDLGPYPALVSGKDVIAGELWRFSPEDFLPTLAALDRIEGFAGQPDVLYRREVITCQTTAGSESAWTYVLARTERLRESKRIQPDGKGQCHWPPTNGESSL